MGVMWAVAVLGETWDAAGGRKLLEEAAFRLSDLDSTQLARITWAFSVSSCMQPWFMEELSKQVSLALSAFRPQDLASISWAFATVAATEHGPLTTAISAAAVQLLSESCPRSLAN